MLFAQENGLFNLFQMVDRLYLIGRLVPLFTFITGVLSSFFLLLVFNRHHFISKMNLDGDDGIHKHANITAETIRYYSSLSSTSSSVRSSINSDGFKRLSIDSVYVRENDDCRGG